MLFDIYVDARLRWDAKVEKYMWFRGENLVNTLNVGRCVRTQSFPFHTVGYVVAIDRV
jgi:phage terminase large subunit-like protein